MGKVVKGKRVVADRTDVTVLLTQYRAAKDAEAAALQRIDDAGKMSLDAEPLYIVKAYRLKRPQTIATAGAG